MNNEKPLTYYIKNWKNYNSIEKIDSSPEAEKEKKMLYMQHINISENMVLKCLPEKKLPTIMKQMHLNMLIHKQNQEYLEV